MPKSILILTPDFKMTGGVSNYYQTINLHSEPNISLFHNTSFNEKSIIAKTIGTLKRFVKFTYVLITNKFDIIHLNPSLDKTAFYRDGVYILICKLFKKSIVVFFHGWEEKFEDEIKKSRLKTEFLLHTFSKANTTIVLGETFKSKLLNLGYSKNHSFFKETTFADTSYDNNTFFDEKLQSVNKKIKILFISRIEKAKGIYIAIDAFRDFQKKNPQLILEFNIAGTGFELDNVKDYVSKTGSDSIFILGNVKGEKKGLLFRESHILLFPSYYPEGLPTCILEAMLYGMPVITRPAGATGEIIKNNENGFISESLNYLDYSDFLAELLLIGDTYLRIAKNNRQVALEKYTTHKTRERILNIYSKN